MESRAIVPRAIDLSGKTVTVMLETLRICLFDSAEPTDPPFEQAFRQLKHLQIVGLASTWDELHEWLLHGSVGAVAINLDDPRGEGVAVVERVSRAAPGCGIVGVSSRTDPGFIIAAMRAGCSQFVPWPIGLDDLRQATDRLLTTRRAAAPQQGKRLCVIGSSGGVGATTVACNLAMELSHLADRTTALVDMNLEFGDVSCAFDCTPKYSIVDVCRHGVESDHSVIEKALHLAPCNVAIMARPEQIEDAREVSPEGVQAMLAILSEAHPFVVVDLPRIFSFLSAAAVNDADRLLIVTQLSVPCLRNATRIYRCLTQMGADEERIEIVLNRCKASFERITPDEVEAHFKRPVFAMIPNDYRRVQSALDLGNPVMTDAPNSPARLAIHEMAKKIIGGHPAEEPAAVSSGLFGRFWRRGAKAES